MSQPSRPSYQGRPLPRPDEELVDQGLSFDIGTLLIRRQALRGLGISAAALGLVAGTSDIRSGRRCLDGLAGGRG